MFHIGQTGSGGSVSRAGIPTGSPPAFVPQADGIAADIYMDFIAGNYYLAPPATFSFSRASPLWADNAAGIWTQFPANTPAITNKGLVVNPPGTNLALWCRDLTNAAWVTTAMTAALNQVGVDGVANSATLLTATAPNATVLQAISNPSSTTIGSFFLKRVTGTGVVNVTVDGGTTWTPVTLTTSFTRPFRNQATVTNPSIGIQIVTSGDAVVADFAQCEIATGTLAVPSTPILTTTAQATRAADFASINVVVGSAISLLGIGTPIGGQVGNPVIAAISDGTNNNRFFLGRAATLARAGAAIGGTATNLNSTAWADVPGKFTAAATAGALTACLNAGTVVSAAPAGYPAGLNQINLGAGNATGAAAYWYITSIAAWLNHQATNAALQALTT